MTIGWVDRHIYFGRVGKERDSPRMSSCRSIVFPGGTPPIEVARRRQTLIAVPEEVQSIHGRMWPLCLAYVRDRERLAGRQFCSDNRVSIHDGD